MKKPESTAFADIPRTAKGHFVLNFYAAVYYLINHIRRLSQVGGENLEKTFEKYPFLAGYLDEIRVYLPENVTWKDALGWWEQEITAWEKGHAEHLTESDGVFFNSDGLESPLRFDLPLLSLVEQDGINFQNRIALMVVGLVEEDSRFGTLFAQLQEPLVQRRPCLELIGQIMMQKGVFSGTDPWSVCRPLLSAGLIEAPNRDAARSEWILRVPPILWDVIRGEISSQPAPWCQYHPPDTFPTIQSLIFPKKFIAQLEQVPAVVMSGKAEAIVLRGMQGSERLQVIGSIARALGRGVIEVDGAGFSDGGANGKASQSNINTALLGPLCSMTNSLPVMTVDMGPGETTELPRLTGYQGPLGIIMGFEGGLRGRAAEKAVTLTLPSAKAAHRMRHWGEALAGYEIENLAELGERFHIPGGYIRQAATMAIAHAALEGRDTIRLDDVREACRSLNRQMLDTLADRLEVEGPWDRLVVSDGTMTKLREVEQRCHHREKLLDHLGPAFGSGVNRGVRALFTGSSGTGKTLAAKILAAELGMDLYRVDLAAVINKYIGETEKNLHQVLSRAEELDVLLLLDEGDSLLGSRTEVKSANDRYANLETNYLLQRLENYQGIVVVTTNLGENIDTAFQRRMDVVVNFIRPEAQERWRIWGLHLPENHAVDDPYLEEIALRCELTGGQIRNAALHASLLALDDGGSVVTHWHLEEAIQSEYRKAGAICPLNESGLTGQPDGGMEAFLDALRFET